MVPTPEMRPARLHLRADYRLVTASRAVITAAHSSSAPWFAAWVGAGVLCKFMARKAITGPRSWSPTRRAGCSTASKPRRQRDCAIARSSRSRFIAFRRRRPMLYTARSAQVRLRIMLPVSHPLRYTIRKGSQLRFDERAPLDGGLSASVHHHEKAVCSSCPRGPEELVLAEICTIVLHSSYTAKICGVMLI